MADCSALATFSTSKNINQPEKYEQFGVTKRQIICRTVATFVGV